MSRIVVNSGFAAGCALLCALHACSEDAEPVSPFAASVRTIVVEVDYAAGAEPYTGEAGQLGDIWGLFGENAARIFGEAKTVTFPSQLDQMERLDDVTGTSFSVDEILALAEEHRDEASTDSVVTYYVLWLDGFFRDDEVEEGVLGVSLGTTGVIAMFKPVIASVAAPGAGEALERFVEQTTLVHEFGHAVGLVNNGVPLTNDHHDEANGAHCTNTECVMFWSNEGVRDLVPFVQRFRDSGSTTLFGPECLQDVDALASP